MTEQCRCASSSDSGRDRRGGEFGSSQRNVDVPVPQILEEIAELVRLGPHCVPWRWGAVSPDELVTEADKRDRASP